MKSLKNIFLSSLLFSASALAQVSDPVLMTVNGKEVKRSEFEYAYNKNNSNLVDGGQTVEDYLPMYIDFKLKVAEAEALGFDTVPISSTSLHVRPPSSEKVIARVKGPSIRKAPISLPSGSSNT